MSVCRNYAQIWVCVYCVWEDVELYNACLQVYTYCWKLCSAPDECVLFHTKLISLFQSSLSHLHSAPPSSSLLPGFTHYKSSLTPFQLFSPLLRSLAYFVHRLSFFTLPFLLICSSFHISSPTFCNPPPTPGDVFSVYLFFSSLLFGCLGGKMEGFVYRWVWVRNSEEKKSISGCTEMFIIYTEMKYK